MESHEKEDDPVDSDEGTEEDAYWTEVPFVSVIRHICPIVCCISFKASALWRLITIHLENTVWNERLMS